ncbi:MAG: sigma-70 family RNA polymerase sigma factor [Candidatus Shapirobacteria bacterium]|nr:sigma-70 family RNA polymerase sigma factor [Candidatus Shapirobacteria bacterium]MDD4410112.1 sigma-70 family RNA polymerase sigma factor [Candidatus Shapirobacteria bacterium]
MEDFYNKYYLGVKKFVSQKIDDEGVAEELTNDIMLAAIMCRPNFDGKCNEFSWICSIAKHKIIDYYRKKKLKTILFSVSPNFEEIADKALTPERDVLKNELKEEIKKTFKELGKGYKDILRLKYIDEMKVSEIAKSLRLTIKAVESKLIRAKKKFREAWIYDKKKN